MVLIFSVSHVMYQRQAEKPHPKCGYCGRILDSGFNYMCHVCGATYCYAHKPDRCDHRKVQIPAVNLSSRSKE